MVGKYGDFLQSSGLHDQSLARRRGSWQQDSLRNACAESGAGVGARVIAWKGPIINVG
jgi:hypothetical protein